VVGLALRLDVVVAQADPQVLDIGLAQAALDEKNENLPHKRRHFKSICNGTYWATQWAAVRMWLSSMSEPPQNCLLRFIKAA
jgi:hypothetical protein